MVVFLLTFLVSAAWTDATPIFGGPDEPSHIARAASAVRGQIITPPVGMGANARTFATIPIAYAATPPVPCIRFHPTIPASCLVLNQGATPTTVISDAGRYPPLYYLAVGVPALAVTSSSGIYLMRLIGALLNSLFIALAFLAVIAYSRHRFVAIGVLIGITPMAWFLSGVINPNGLEITTALCLWCSAAVLTLERADDPPRGLVAIAACSIAVLTLTRQLSPLWPVVIVALLILLHGPRRTLASTIRNPVLFAIPAIYIAALVPAVLWTFSQNVFDISTGVQYIAPGTSNAHILVTSIGQSGAWLKQMIGVFGWLDTYPPGVVYVLWGFCASALLVLALLVARLRGVLVLLLLLALIIAIPVSAQDAEARQVGYIWQGRYILPLAAGVPVLCAFLIDRSGFLTRVRGRLTVLLLVCIGAGNFLSFCEALRRYAVGTNGPLDYFHGPWAPPGGALALTLFFLVATVLLLGAAAHVSGVWTRFGRHADTPPLLTSSPAS